jgi:hypothetical protein
VIVVCGTPGGPPVAGPSDLRERGEDIAGHGRAAVSSCRAIR